MAVLGFEIECLAILGRTREMNERWDLFKDKEVMAFRMVEISRLLEFYGHKKAAQELAQRALDWYQNQPVPDEEPQRMDFHYEKAHALFWAGKLNEAEKAFMKLAADYPEEIIAQAYLGYIAAQKKEREKALQISEKLKKSGLHIREKSFFRANIACQLGDFDEAFELLKIAWENGCWELFFWDRYGHVLLKPMLDYPPFRKFREPKG
jgi:tetratricopeptide (TPR) repeat protein